MKQLGLRQTKNKHNNNNLCFFTHPLVGRDKVCICRQTAESDVKDSVMQSHEAARGLTVNVVVGKRGAHVHSMTTTNEMTTAPTCFKRKL